MAQTLLEILAQLRHFSAWCLEFVTDPPRVQSLNSPLRQLEVSVVCSVFEGPYLDIFNFGYETQGYQHKFGNSLQLNAPEFFI